METVNTNVRIPAHASNTANTATPMKVSAFCVQPPGSPSDPTAYTLESKVSPVNPRGAPNGPVVVNEAFMRAVGSNPVGARVCTVQRGSERKPGPWHEIVGVVGLRRRASSELQMEGS